MASGSRPVHDSATKWPPFPVWADAVIEREGWRARPVLGHGDYRAPITGLYMCGAGTHPGGGVTGAPGHNAAKVVARDLR